MKLKSLDAVILLVVLACSSSAGAVDVVTVEGGHSTNVGVNRVGVTANWQFDDNLASFAGLRVEGFVEVGGSYWDGDRGLSGHASLAEVGIAPVLRFVPAAANSPTRVFGEIGLGAHLMSRSAIDVLDFDHGFAFGSHLGLGVRFGTCDCVELSYRFQHLSNAGLGGGDNPGINFNMIRLGYRF